MLLCLLRAVNDAGMGCRDHFRRRQLQWVCPGDRKWCWCGALLPFPTTTLVRGLSAGLAMVPVQGVAALSDKTIVQGLPAVLVVVLICGITVLSNLGGVGYY